jgi:hypothetical protein
MVSLSCVSVYISLQVYETYLIIYTQTLALMSNMFVKKNEQNLLLKDIQEFIDLPQDES